jgi:S-adenosylmethionine:tRNA ribosyltransferase-isomerase
VKVANAAEHPMHQEQVVVNRDNVENLLKKRKVISVGTTSLRTLESIYWYGVKLSTDPESKFVIGQEDAYQLPPIDKTKALNQVLKKMSDEKVDQLVGETSIYLLPGYRFQIAEALITNFHQPGSTLILLIAAFVGRDWKTIYESALANNYRFLSYGDSSLLFRN